MNKNLIADYIRRYYRAAIAPNLPSPPALSTDSVASLTATGIGDSLMLTDLPEASKDIGLVHVWAGCPAFDEVMKFHPSYHHRPNRGARSCFLIDILHFRDRYNLGPGHLLQQLRRAWRLPVSAKPMPVLRCDVPKIKNRVLLHFEPSLLSSARQRQLFHRRMRELYPESKLEIEAFIRSRPGFEFIEVGLQSKNIHGARFEPTASIPDLVKLVASSEWFIGIMSGPLNIAMATGVKCIVICNYPAANKIVLPCLKKTGEQEEEWCYPQNVHLHQEDESFLVPKLSAYSLAAAFGGDVYPFWEDS